VRTFALCALAGAAAQWLGPAAVVAGGLVVGLLALAGYRHTRIEDPGLTTEIAMLATFLLGMMALRAPLLAAGLGVVVAALLAAKHGLHRFVREGLSEQELEDLLLLLAAAFVVLPLLPAAPVDPWGALAPRRLWTLVVAVMAVSSAGYVALRTLGPRLGLAMAGLVGGFVSSTATIAALGARAKATPALAGSLASAALVSNVGTIVQLAIVLGTLSPPLLVHAAWPLAAAGAVALFAAIAASFHAERGAVDARALAGPRALQPRQALVFVAIVAVVFLLAAIARERFGEASLPWVLALSGLADVHAAAASGAQLAAAGLVGEKATLLAICAALATNSAMKCAMAMLQGGRAYALRVVPGVVGMVLAFLGAVAFLAF
jgi:uncharacterized membrane protein (DUF4010 family)